MPLGVFIKPSQEKMACDGKRAFHMCSMMTPEAAAHAAKSNRISFTSQASGLEKHAKAQGAGGDEFLAAHRPLFHAPASVFWPQESFVSPQSAYYSSLYRPPQAAPVTF
jgi:hypothetical protein